MLGESRSKSNIDATGGMAAVWESIRKLLDIIFQLAKKVLQWAMN
jgi:hypothetical protein